MPSTSIQCMILLKKLSLKSLESLVVHLIRWLARPLAPILASSTGRRTRPRRRILCTRLGQKKNVNLMLPLSGISDASRVKCVDVGGT
jgi:hypothetical protein